MNMHKRLRLTPLDREEIWKRYQDAKNGIGKFVILEIAREFRVSRPTIYKVIQRARLQEFAPRKSVNKRFQSIEFGIKRLAKIEKSIEERLKREAKRYNKSYPGELVHFDTKRLPLLTGEKATNSREYLFVAIDDFSRELYAGIYPDKSQVSSASFLEQVVKECPYTIEYTYSDNGKEFKGLETHEFVRVCQNNNIGQKFTRVARPQTNGKAERVIRTIMELWHEQTEFKDREERQRDLKRFINFYNTVRPHSGIGNATPLEKLEDYFFKQQT
jgi:transposase InsO family protein